MGERRSATLERPAASTPQPPARPNGVARPEGVARQLPLLPDDPAPAGATNGWDGGIAPGWLAGKAGGSPGGRRPGRPDRVALEIGAAIAARRQERGMNQAELAQALGCDRSAVSRWEMGLRLPTIPHLLALGQALGCGGRALLPE